MATQDLRFVTTLFANTVDARQKKVFDQVHGNIPFLAYMRSPRSRAVDRDGMGKGIRLYTGGGKFRITVINQTNPNFAWSSGFDGINTATSEEETDAFEVMRKASSSVGISGDDIDDNQGEHQLRNMLEQKVDVMVMGFQDQLEQGLVAGKVGTTGAQPARRMQPHVKGPNPLAYLIQKEFTNADGIHEINQNTETWWRNQVKLSAGSTYHLIRQEMFNMYNNCTAHSDTSAPDFGLCDQGFYEWYEASMIAQQRFPAFGSTSTEQSIGFRGLAFHDMLIFWSKNVPDYADNATNAMSLTQNTGRGQLLFLNSGALEMYVSKRINMRVGEFIEPYDQDAIWGKMLHRVQLCTPQRRKLGVLYNIDLAVAV